jgi:hypothetical protein
VINWTVVIVDVEEYDDGEAQNATTTFTASSSPSSTTCCRADPDRLDALDLESAMQCAPSVLFR